MKRRKLKLTKCMTGGRTRPLMDPKQSQLLTPWTDECQDVDDWNERHAAFLAEYSDLLDKVGLAFEDRRTF